MWLCSLSESTDNLNFFTADGGGRYLSAKTPTKKEEKPPPPFGMKRMNTTKIRTVWKTWVKAAFDTVHSTTIQATPSISIYRYLGLRNSTLSYKKNRTLSSVHHGSATSNPNRSSDIGIYHFDTDNIIHIQIHNHQCLCDCYKPPIQQRLSRTVCTPYTNIHNSNDDHSGIWTQMEKEGNIGRTNGR